MLRLTIGSVVSRRSCGCESSAPSCCSVWRQIHWFPVCLNGQRLYEKRRDFFCSLILFVCFVRPLQDGSSVIVHCWRGDLSQKPETQYNTSPFSVHKDIVMQWICIMFVLPPLPYLVFKNLQLVITHSGTVCMLYVCRVNVQNVQIFFFTKTN